MSIMLRLKFVLKVTLQVLLYSLIFIFSEWLVKKTNFPLPANIIGMVIMLMLIIFRIFPLNWVKAGSTWLLTEMLLFFVPAVVAVVNYSHLLMFEGWRIFLVILFSTILTLSITGLVVERIYNIEMRIKGKSDD